MGEMPSGSHFFNSMAYTSINSAHNHQKAWDYFKSIGKIPANAQNYEYVLHHKDPSLHSKDPKRYDEWRIEDLEVMEFGEHTRLHHIGMCHTEETKEKCRLSKIGHKHTEESKQLMSKNRKGICAGKDHPNYGKHRSEETKQKLREANLGANSPVYGCHWYNNGVVSVCRPECPDGFVPGRIKRKSSST